MDIVLLDYYLRLFAIIANLFPQLLTENVKDFLKSTILKSLNEDIKIECLNLYNEYYSQYSNVPQKEIIQILWKTINHINVEIPKKQKFQILLRLLLFEKLLLKYSSAEQEITYPDITEFVIQEFNISTAEYNNCKGFISGKYFQIEDLQKLLIVSDEKSFQLDLPFLQRKNFPGQLIFLYLENHDTILFSYKGYNSITYNKQTIYAQTIYFFNKGTSINGDGFEPVFYNQVLRKFKINEHVSLKMQARNLEFRYKNSNNGIHKLNINLESEQLIGIIGRSGVGKSTLINLLIGKKQPTQGTVTINGINLNQNDTKLDGLIGYVSQDDLLLEELTVFMNLFLNAQLCFGGLSNEILEQKVNNLLSDLDLYDVRNMQVGNPLHRLISGGQRKKLNIALELIREPWILFADEPTSGLSSSDSEEIMHLLSGQTVKGKIVVVNIHQPSSDVFKMFDKIIVLDKEGYPVYFGSPLEAISYFNDFYQKVAINADSCNICENVNPETIFKVLEEKKIDEFGEFTKERKTAPKEWHQHYLAKNGNISDSNQEPADLPASKLDKPGALKQFLIFYKRNLLTKLTNYQYISLALIISPLLAVVLALLCKYNNIDVSSNKYSFAFNENIPSYFFMSVIVALFLGLIMSAEEIIRDRKIIMRESYLKLKKISYLNSKVAFVFAISALQSFLYVTIGNAILGIQGMNVSFWLILFSTSCFANLLGLVISSMLSSVIAIYIMVPLIIVPQMLLSGVVVKYDKINKYVSSHEYVPFVGDIMASRWAYEAMVIRQFSANDYQKYYFDIEKQESNVKFDLLFVVPEIKKALLALKKEPNSAERSQKIKFLKTEIKKLKKKPFPIELINNKPKNIDLMIKRIDKYNKYLSEELDRISVRKDAITNNLVQKFTNVENYLECKNQNYNNSLADIVLEHKSLNPYSIMNSKIIRLLEPIYHVPSSTLGRAHFLSSVKKLGNNEINTFSFNIAAIWLMAIITYITLILIFLKKPYKLNLKLSKLK